MIGGKGQNFCKSKTNVQEARKRGTRTNGKFRGDPDKNILNFHIVGSLVGSFI